MMILFNLLMKYPFYYYYLLFTELHIIPFIFSFYLSLKVIYLYMGFIIIPNLNIFSVDVILGKACDLEAECAIIMLFWVCPSLKLMVLLMPKKFSCFYFNYVKPHHCSPTPYLFAMQFCDYDLLEAIIVLLTAKTDSQFSCCLME